MGTGTHGRDDLGDRGDRQREVTDSGEIEFSKLPVDSVAELKTLEQVPEGFYAALPPDLERNEIRNYLPWWVEVAAADPTQGQGGHRGKRNIHLPAEGSTREDSDVDKLCAAAVSALDDKDIAVHPKGFTDKCDRCVDEYRERAGEE